MKVNFHNQCSGIKLMNGRSFASSTYWNKYPNREINAGGIMSVELLPFLSTFEGSLTYQLQRKHVRFDDQLESTYTLLLVGWKSDSYKGFRVLVQLIECDKTFSWHKITQKEYYQRYADQLSTYTGPIKDTWLIHDGTVLMTRLELNFTQRDSVLSVTISEGIRNSRTKISVWIDPER
jgi:hypothetical protein